MFAEKESLKSLAFTAKEFVCKKTHLELIGNRRAILEGSMGVLEYTDTCIRVSLKESVLSFKGKSLNLKCISSTDLIVEGFIESVSFSQ